MCPKSNSWWLPSPESPSFTASPFSVHSISIFPCSHVQSLETCLNTLAFMFHNQSVRKCYEVGLQNISRIQSDIPSPLLPLMTTIISSLDFCNNLPAGICPFSLGPCSMLFPWISAWRCPWPLLCLCSDITFSMRLTLNALVKTITSSPLPSQGTLPICFTFLYFPLVLSTFLHITH